MSRYCSIYTPNRTCPPANFSYPPLSSSYSQFDYITECYLVILVAIFGLTGNILSIIIMYKDKERREILFLLQILAVADSFYLVMCLLRYPMKYFLTINNYYMMQLYVFPIMKTAQTAAVWAMLLVTVDRYIYICEPFRARQKVFCRARRIMAGLVFVIALLYNLPRFFDSCLMAIIDICSNTKIITMVYSPTFNRGNIYLNVYVLGLYILSLYLGPLMILVVLNVKLISAIRKSRKRHQRISIGESHNENQRNGETNATMILIIIIIIFIICETPELVIKIISLLNRHLDFISRESRIFNTLSTVSTLLLVANSAVNFIVYVAYGKRFRWIIYETLGLPWTCERFYKAKQRTKDSHSVRLYSYKKQLSDEDNVDRNGSVTQNTVLLPNNTKLT